MGKKTWLNKKFTFYVLTDERSAPRRFFVPFSAVLLVFALFAVFAFSFASLVFQNRELNGIREKAQSLHSRSVIARKENIRQRQELIALTRKLNELQDTVCGLQELEEKVRVLTDLEVSGDSTGLLGIGGAFPEDIDPAVALAKGERSLVLEMEQRIRELKEVSDLQGKDLHKLVGHLEEKKKRLACTPSIRPVEGGWITSLFGNRKSPFTGLKVFHRGLDIAAAKGTPIIAPADGKVVFAGWKNRLGKVVVIDHGYGIVTRYGHCLKRLKKKGDKIKRGDVIALVGATGRTTGSHLHYEVHLKGVHVNPQRFILN